MSTILLLAFARYRERLGFDRREAHLPEPPTVEALRATLPALPPEALVAVNRVLAGPEAILQAGDEVALMPPVSGG